MLSLLTRRDRRTGATNRQDAVVPTFFFQATGQKITQVLIADGFTSGELAVAKQQKRFAIFDPLQLT